MAPLAPFKASFKDPFKTRPPTEIRAFSITILNLVPLNVYKRLLNVNIAMFVKCFLKIHRIYKILPSEHGTRRVNKHEFWHCLRIKRKCWYKLYSILTFLRSKKFDRFYFFPKSFWLCSMKMKYQNNNKTNFKLLRLLPCSAIV